METELTKGVVLVSGGLDCISPLQRKVLTH